MKQLVIIGMLIMGIFATLPGNMNSITFDNSWTINYSIQSGVIYVEAIGTNKGAIAIGFGGNSMASIDVAHFYYDSTVKFADRSYINPTAPVNNLPQVLEDTARTPPGMNDIQDNGTTFDATTGAWKTNFQRKLDTTDVYDNKIVEGTDIQLSIALFASQAWGNKHTSTSVKTVQFTSQLINSAATQLILFFASLLAFLLI